MLAYKDWNIEELTGYEPQTTFYMDYSIAERFGVNAVKETFERAFENWKNDIVYVTELSMATNWKIWEHYEKNEKLARVYNELWERIDSWCMENLKGEDMKYYLRTTD